MGARRKLETSDALSGNNMEIKEEDPEEILRKRKIRKGR